jgi:type IV secretory pathway TraG/TraD family ATPase VirD4
MNEVFMPHSMFVALFEFYGLTLIGSLLRYRQKGRLPRDAWRAAIAAVFGLAVAFVLALILALVLPSGPDSWPEEMLRITLNIGALVLGGYLFTCYALRDRAESPDQYKRGTILRARAPQSSRSASATGLTIGGVAIPPSDETKHFKLIGTTGAGKSTAMREMLSSALARGDRAIIADPDGGYLARFLDPTRGDVILNPFDPRTVRWDLFAEIDKPYDVDQLARSLIAEGPDPSGYEWRGFARTLLGSILEYCKTEDKTDLSELYRLLVVADQEELQQVLAGSAAQPLVDGKESKMFRSVRGTATPLFNALKYLRDSKGERFSVREWVRNGKGVLFLPYQAGQIASLKTLIAAWLRIAIFEAMSQPEGDQRLWFAIDEVDALGQIDGLKDALARLRKFGGRCILGLQSIAQMRGSYGDTDAQTIVENCGNTVILRCSASERGGTADFASRLIGRREIIRQHVSTSRPDGFFDGGNWTRTQSEHHSIEDAVMPSQIEQLPDLAGYLKVASQAAWQVIRLRYQPSGQ